MNNIFSPTTLKQEVDISTALENVQQFHIRYNIIYISKPQK